MKYLIYNWKASLPESLHQWVDAVKKAQEQVGVSDTFIIAPPCSHIDVLEKEASLQGLSYQKGAQDVSAFPQGAYTGDIPAPLLTERGVLYVLVGHSERRRLHGETTEVIEKKVVAAQKEGLIPIICIGEENRDDDLTLYIDEASLFLEKGVSMIAYEPQWAIGGDAVLDPSMIEKRITLFREKLDRVGKEYVLLYGGSVSGDILSQLLCYTGIDGFLVGSASVDTTQSNIIYTSIYG